MDSMERWILIFFLFKDGSSIIMIQILYKIFSFFILRFILFQFLFEAIQSKINEMNQI